MSEKQIDAAAYYHARAADMMAKAQAASSKAVRAAYLNLAQVWARKAAALEKEWVEAQRTSHPDGADCSALGGKMNPIHRGQGTFS